MPASNRWILSRRTDLRKRTLLTGTALVVALVAVLAVAAVAWAQGPVDRSDAGTPMGQGYRFQDTDTDGVCDNCVDEDGDGVCDLMGTGWEDGRGRSSVGQSGFGQFIPGRMGSQGLAACDGDGFQDEDGNGVCANFVDEDGDGACDMMNAQSGFGASRMGGRNSDRNSDRMSDRMGGRWAAPQAAPGK